MIWTEDRAYWRTARLEPFAVFLIRFCVQPLLRTGPNHQTPLSSGCKKRFRDARLRASHQSNDRSGNPESVAAIHEFKLTSFSSAVASTKTNQQTPISLSEAEKSALIKDVFPSRRDRKASRAQNRSRRPGLRSEFPKRTLSGMPSRIAWSGAFEKEVGYRSCITDAGTSAQLDGSLFDRRLRRSGAGRDELLLLLGLRRQRGFLLRYAPIKRAQIIGPIECGRNRSRCALARALRQIAPVPFGMASSIGPWLRGSMPEIWSRSSLAELFMERAPPPPPPPPPPPALRNSYRHTSPAETSLRPSTRCGFPPGLVPGSCTRCSRARGPLPMSRSRTAIRIRRQRLTCFCPTRCSQGFRRDDRIRLYAHDAAPAATDNDFDGLRSDIRDSFILAARSCHR